MDDRDIVRTGYDRIGDEYVEKRPADGEDVQFLDHLIERLDDGARVLDAGCGPGEPVTRLLSRRYDVVGVDFSREQLRLARERLPDADFCCQDLTQLGFAAESFAAIVSYYALIHVPREHDREMFGDLHRLLEPGGLAVLCLGGSDGAEIRDDAFMEAGVELFWSTHDEETYHELLADLGFDVHRSEWLADPTKPGSEHLFVLVEKA